MDILSLIKKYQVQLVFLIICITSFALFYPSLNYYFFQDDWFVLNWVRTGDLKSFFEFRTDIIYWRPLSMPSFFWMSKNLFGFNPFGYHLATFIFHLINILLLAYLTDLLLKSKKAALITAFLYSTASFHFMSLSWLSLAWNVIGLLFFQIALIFYLSFRKKAFFYNAVLALIFFIFAILSNEFTIVFPLALIISDFILGSKFNFDYLRNNFVLMCSSAIVVAYLTIRIFIYPIPSEAEYSIAVDQRIFKNILWYALWLLNLPEELKYQVILSKFQITQIFLNAAKNYLPYILILFVANLITLFAILVGGVRNKSSRLLVAATIFFTLGLMPVLILPNHSFPYYLTIPSLFVFILIGKASSSYFKNMKSKRAVMIILSFIVTWVALSLLTLILTRKIHWITAEQNLSREKIEFIKNQYPTLPRGLIVEIPNSSKQIIQSLMDQDALKVIFNSDDIKTIYK